MFKMQSKNVTTLCSELGFGEQFPGRDSKAFQKSIADFRTEFVALGNSLPPTRPDSLEAQQFALAFCLENGRGETLWPSNNLRKWPWWSTDRPEILKNLAHIFALQAFYKYHRNLKAEKKDMPTPRDVSSAPPQDERELSPESSKYVINLPAGTRRRPAKHAGSPGAQSDAENARVLEASIEEVLALDPRNDDKPAIKEFTTQWLARATSRWPTTADVRLRTLMHNHDFYDGDDTDITLKIVNPLRKGTEIAECDIVQYKEFVARICERVSFHAKELCAKNFIQYESGNKPQKNPVFRDVWKNRHTYWGPKERQSKGPTAERVLDIYDIDSLPDDKDPIISRPPKNHRSNDMPPPPRPSSLSFFAKYATNTSPKILGRRKAEDSIEQASMTHQQKKQKTDTGVFSNSYTNSPYTKNNDSTPSVARSLPFIANKTSTSNADETPTPSSEEPAQPIQPQQEAFTDQNLQETIRMHEEFLSNDAEEANTAPLKTTTPPQTPKLLKPLTPTSPVNIPYLSEQVSKVQEASTSTLLPGSLSPQPKIELKPLLSLTRDHRRSSAPSPQPNRQHLLLFIQGSDGKWDFAKENSTHLKNSSVAEFFELYSQKSRVPLEALTCLTFTFVFADGEEMTVHRDEVAEWERLKDLTSALFPLHRKRKSHESKFPITVEIGDKTSKIKDRDDEDDSWGF